MGRHVQRLKGFGAQGELCCGCVAGRDVAIHVFSWIATLHHVARDDEPFHSQTVYADKSLGSSESLSPPLGS